MPRITYIEHDGTAHEVEVHVGYSVMEGAIRNNVPGIDADCGGACACATCTVQVAAAWLERLDPASEMEMAMLEMAEKADPGERLSCQIIVKEEFDGLTVRTPQRQHW